MKKWETVNKSKIKNQRSKIKKLQKILLENRGIKTKKEREEFINPQLKRVTTKNVGINKIQLRKTINRIKKAIKDKEQIIVFGDYDVDGVCSTAILWETLNNLKAIIIPYIPHRVDEGYGLSAKGISNIKNQISNTKLIITVDNGIVANEAVEFANKEKIDVIITDHHVLPKKLPKAFAIVHTTKLCGAGVAWALAQELKVQNSKFKDGNKDNHLELVALATVADMVPLTGANRTLVKLGLEELKKTERIGLLELFKEAALDQRKLSTYEIGHIIAPRLNAMGRLEYAMDSLRLLCTKNRERAVNLARLLGQTNRERQNLTQETTIDAKTIISSLSIQKKKKLIFVSNESYQQGVIGLVAGKLVEEYYRPTIVVSKGEVLCKASARSISGFNIIEFIRLVSEDLVDAGGHPMAAGFTVETNKLSLVQKKLEDLAEKMLDDEKLKRTLRIDCELSLDLVNEDFYHEIQKLTPFGVGNPEPTFMSKKVLIEDMRLVGNGGKHIKFKIKSHPFGKLRTKVKSEFLNQTFEAIAFGIGEKMNEFYIGDKVDIVYTVYQDEWNGNKRLQLKIKDIKTQRS